MTFWDLVDKHYWSLFVLGSVVSLFGFVPLLVLVIGHLDIYLTKRTKR